MNVEPPNEGDTVRVDYTDRSRLVPVPRTTVGKVSYSDGDTVCIRPYSSREGGIDVYAEDGRFVAYCGRTGEQFGSVERIYTAERTERAEFPTSSLR